MIILCLFGWAATAGWAGWMLCGAHCLASPAAPPANPAQPILGSRTGGWLDSSWWSLYSGLSLDSYFAEFILEIFKRFIMFYL